MVWYGMVWYGMVGYGMIWYDMIWHDMIFRVYHSFTSKGATWIEEEEEEEEEEEVGSIGKDNLDMDQMTWIIGI